jgi:hypothetical protein
MSEIRTAKQLVRDDGRFQIMKAALSTIMLVRPRRKTNL